MDHVNLTALLEDRFDGKRIHLCLTAQMEIIYLWQMLVIFNALSIIQRSYFTMVKRPFSLSFLVPTFHKVA